MTLIYKSREDHLLRLSEVFIALDHHMLMIQLKKCAFIVLAVIVLGYIVSGEGLSVNLAKIQVMVDWHTFHSFSSS